MLGDFLERFDSAGCSALRRGLLKWYKQHGRSLPWRETRDPYRIWISEIMLQQTTVKAVIPYYERFLRRFPDLQSLAAASEAEVLQYWEGLGYYSRGRNLRLAAQAVCERHSGVFPSELDAIQGLPGIGRYTAGAIRSFAFDLPAPIVEANTLRLYCRLLGYDGDPRSTAGQNLLWEFAERLQPRVNAGHVNQALMELGATVCTPVQPACERCPISRYCVAFAENRQAEIPAKKARPRVTQTVEATVAVRRGDQYLIRQRTKSERWAGMWDFVRFPVESVTPEQSLTKALQAKLQKEATEQVHKISAVEVTALMPVTEIRHSVTRYRIRLICLTGELSVEGRVLSVGEETAALRWVTLEELRGVPMPVTGRQFAGMLRASPDR
ncbi:A/G-specific adenine glycosylase [Planctomicrobium piriforme]|uniref:Adenine DNA glycosylase n=1 Tax=Planctomicrobium piriforme TaxID=1576369 RepID=A0A1I3NPC5_9PLAN|nr:A/G-specific adenine glycosylase [Planctomicrobium piriforme]SFJ11168.1 A/G-specific adenine glycosylase [Planctomicrobium piriforme]